MTPLARTIAMIEPHAQPGLMIDADTELATALCGIDRIYSLSFWLEEATGEMPTDAELLSWVTVGDVARWLGVVERRAA